MRNGKLLLISIALILSLTIAACSNKPAEQTASGTNQQQQQPAATPAQEAPSTPDELTAELSKLAGSNGTDCGRVGINGEVSEASKCALTAFEAKKPFFVRYDLPVPGTKMSIATVRSADGKLYTAQFDSTGFEKAPEDGKLMDNKKVAISPCPKPEALRLAGSGRVTCFPPSQMPTGMSPHGGGMQMPPATGPNPHQGSGMGATQKSH
jgi:hypothetical protein